jgi:hypothetical protein
MTPENLYEASVGLSLLLQSEKTGQLIWEKTCHCQLFYSKDWSTPVSTILDYSTGKFSSCDVKSI